MTNNAVAETAELLGRRNAIDEAIARIIRRPMTSGHLGEWIASRVFDIELESSATAPAIDGRFRAGPVADRSVNIKWYLKREGLLDISSSPAVDYYLILTGPSSAAVSSRGGTRPWRIDAVYLFDGHKLHPEQGERGVKLGVASSVRAVQRLAAEIHPTPTNTTLPVTAEQSALLGLFRPRQTAQEV